MQLWITLALLDMVTGAFMVVVPFAGVIAVVTGVPMHRRCTEYGTAATVLLLRARCGAAKRKTGAEERSLLGEVRAVEEETGKPFGQVVRALRLRCEPAEILGRLTVSRHFLYEYFGRAMDRVAYVERVYGAPLPRSWPRGGRKAFPLLPWLRSGGWWSMTRYGALRRSAPDSAQTFG